MHRSFPEAFEAMRSGTSMRRAEWRPNKWVAVEKNAGGFLFLQMSMKDGRFNAYVPSQCDMFADDWTEAPVSADVIKFSES